ncbi:uncharacterized protein LOC127289736 [Leptopilina boulardi]|uniref:uncharacterized protein LOC127289736 n=1 Tax=Leptopilina boulardi TaxID=63433 RepID=UPI0021F5A67F|nr:uncharacterized protein LOC127289736 [Leptopilina boulardi]
MYFFFRILFIFLLLLCVQIINSLDNDANLEVNNCPQMEPNMTNLINPNDPRCLNFNINDVESVFNRYPLEEVYNLTNPNLVIIMADNSSDAVNLAKFLSNNNKLLPHKYHNKTKFWHKLNSTEYEFIVKNFQAYENQNKSMTFIVYPRNIDDKFLAAKLVAESVSQVETVQLILTLPHFADEKLDVRVRRIFEFAGDMLKNVKKYRGSYCLVVTNNGEDESIAKDIGQMNKGERIYEKLEPKIKVVKEIQEIGGRIRRNVEKIRRKKRIEESSGVIQEASETSLEADEKLQFNEGIKETSGKSLKTDEELKFNEGIEETNGKKPKTDEELQFNEGINETSGKSLKPDEELKSNETIKETSETNLKINGDLQSNEMTKETNEQNPKVNEEPVEFFKKIKEPNDKININIRKLYIDLINKYANNGNTSSKYLAKMINEQNIIIGEFTSTGQRKLINHLYNMERLSANIYDHESRLHQFLECSSNSINKKLNSPIRSLISRIHSKLTDNESNLTTLTSVFTVTKNFNIANKSLSTFFNCIHNNMNIFLKKCSDKLAHDLKPLEIDLVDFIEINDLFSTLCWLEKLFIVIEIEHNNIPIKWITIVENFLQQLKYPTNWYWNLQRIFNDIEPKRDSLSLDEIDIQLDNLIREITINGNYNFSFMINAIRIVRDDLRKKPIKISCHRESIVKLQVTGELLRFSEILNATSDCQDYKILEIFALEKIIIDQDLIAIGEEILVSIFAPIWEVVMNRRIILDGASRNLTNDDYMTPKGKNGNTHTNRNGIHGLAGFPGGPAGSFYGIAEKIIGQENLTISLNGGNGSNGQNGGDGANGEDGETPSASYIHSMFNYYHCNWLNNYQVNYRVNHSSFLKHYIPLFSTNGIAFSYRSKCYIHGLNGFPGGNGGNGGVIGKGGSAGDFHIYPLDINKLPIIVMAKNGSDGKYGIGGRKGLGGSTRMVTIYNENYFEHKIENNETCERANWGKDGRDNYSILGSKIKKESEIKQTFAQTVNLYKRYILTMGEKYEKLYRQIIGKREIIESYDTFALVNELIDLEYYYFRINKKNATLFMYRSWKERLIYYSWHRKEGERTEDYTALLRNLDRMISEKIQRLETNSNERSVFMLKDYLAQCNKMGEYLHNARTVVRIKMINSNFIRDYDDKVKEAQEIIQEKLQKDIQQMNSNLKGETEMLLRKIASLTERERKNSEALEKKSIAMDGRIVAKSVNEIFELINSVLGFINPALATIGRKISAAGSIVQNFIDETADSSIVEVAIPNVVDRSREFFDNWVDMKYEIEKISLENSLEMIEEKKRELRENGDDVKPLDSVASSIIELKDEKILGNDVMKLLDDKLIKEESLWKKLNVNKKFIYNGALKAIEQIRTFTRMKQMLGDLSDKFEDVKNKRQMKEISDKIHNAFEKTINLRNFKEDIYMKMIPLIEKIRDDTDINGKYSESSIAYLDFKKFQMKEYFQEILEQLELFIKQFKLESLFATTMKNMHDVIDMVLSTYERIQEYVDTMKKANYERDLSLAPFDVTYIKNTELSLQLAKMINIIYANNVLDNYNKWISSFRQYIFPFADNFIVHDSSFIELRGIFPKAEEASKILHLLGEKLSRKRAEFNEFEKTNNAKFGYNLPPFYVWENNSNQNEIQQILEGKTINLYADIIEHKILNAVKFRDIWLRLRLIDSTLSDEELRNDIKGFSFKLTHLGDSYYRCDNEVYLISSNSHLFENVYNSLDENDDEENEFHEDDDNNLNEKQKGDYLLSPYATWKIELISRDVDKNFDNLRKYHSKINIELVGFGRYTDRHLDICQSNLTKYYEKVW